MAPNGNRLPERTDPAWRPVLPFGVLLPARSLPRRRLYRPNEPWECAARAHPRRPISGNHRRGSGSDPNLLTGVNVGTSRVRGARRVYASHPSWFEAFPQHGPGRKHTREIELAELAEKAHARPPGGIAARPRPLGRGTRASTASRRGSRAGASPNTRTSATSSRTTQRISRRIFCEHCELLDIRWTQSSFKNISVAHRDSVARLDEFIGPKS